MLFARLKDWLLPSPGADPRPAVEEAARSPELVEAWRYLWSHNLGNAIGGAMRFVDADNPKLRAEANKLVGLAHFEDGQYAAAVPFFERAADGSSVAGDWFNLASAATLGRDIELGQEAIGRALECQRLAGCSQQPGVPSMLLWYASALRDIGEYSLAFEQLEHLRQIHQRGKATDTTLLHIRGIPSLENTMTQAIDVLRGLGPTFDAVGWLDQFALHLDGDGQEYLQRVRSELAVRPRPNHSARP